MRPIQVLAALLARPAAAGVVGAVALACFVWPDSVSQPDGPLDRLDPGAIPAAVRPSDAPRELVAVLGQCGGRQTEQLCSVAVSPDGRWIAAGTRGGVIRVYAVPALSVPWQWCGHGGPVSALDFAPDGRSLVSGGDDGTVRRWAADGAERPGPPAPTHGRPVLAIAHAPDGRAAATAAADGVRLWAVGPGGWAAAGVAPVPGGQVRALAFSPDGGRLACGGGGDNAVRVVRLRCAGPAAEAVWPGPEDFQVRALAFAAGGAALASLDSDGRGAVRDVRGACAAWRVACPPVHKAAFARDGRHLLTVNGTGTAWVLRLRRAWPEL